MLTRWFWLLLMLGAAGAATAPVRADEASDALRARTQWTSAAQAADRHLFAIQQQLYSSPQYLNAVSDVQAARSRVEALRQPVITRLHNSLNWQQLLAQRTRLERKITQLHHQGADFAELAGVSSDLSVIRLQMLKLESEALAAVPELEDARLDWADATYRIQQLRESIPQRVRASSQWQQARQQAQEARQQWITASARAERAAAARWQAEQARWASMFMPH